jgi:hypothetical protein
MNSPLRAQSSGWLLVAALGLCALGMARSSPQQTPPPPAQQPPKTQIVPVATAATADSNNRMIAVTGTDITGASILYLVDTVNNRLAVYQAQGGADGSRGLSFLGARRIDLDLQLDGWNDRSEWTYKKLKDEFSKQGLLPGNAPANADKPVKSENNH